MYLIEQSKDFYLPSLLGHIPPFYFITLSFIPSVEICEGTKRSNNIILKVYALHLRKNKI